MTYHITDGDILEVNVVRQAFFCYAIGLEKETGGEAPMSQYTYQNTTYRQKTRSSHSDFVSLLLYYILPFIVVNGIILFLVIAKPKFDILVGETNDYLSTTITFSIESFLPTKNLSITLNSEPLVLEQTGSRTYTATITENGVINVYLENFNGIAVSTYEHVNVLDADPPNTISYSVKDSVLRVKLSDSQSGIDYSSLRAIDSNGMEFAPLSVDKTTAEVTFAMDPDGLIMFVKDMSGNESEQPFSVKASTETE